MRRFILLAIAALAALAVMPSVALADPAICHNGVLSDDAGQGCADGLYAQVYGSGKAHRSSWGGICHDGILSNDVGQGCSGWSAPQQISAPSYSGGGGNLSAIAQC